MIQICRKILAMKNLCTLLILFCTFSFSLQAQQTKKVLFIGNSYTAVNNLPGMLSSIATSMGNILIQDNNTPGGYTFYAHSTNATTISKINSNDWDYVVLQEQSQLPSFPPAQVASDVYPYADSLNRMIQENDSCTRTMFYMTWGRKNGDASNCAFYTPVCTYDGMQGRLRASYLEMANDLDAEVAPVGAVWKKFRTDFPSVELYNPDESHPSIHGTYLAACTFYASIYHESPVGAFVPVGISVQEASDIQNTVNSIVFDSLDIWRIDTTTVNADFIFSNIINDSYNFTPNYINGDSYYWDFGSGISDTTLSGEILNHNFPGDGIYPVTLIVQRKCDFDTVSQNVVISPFNSIHEMDENEIYFYPNPANDYLQVESKNNTEIFIYDLSGKIILQQTTSRGKTIIPILNLSNGNYFIRFVSEEKSQIKKLSVLK